MVQCGYVITKALCVTFFCFVFTDARIASKNTFRNVLANTSQFNSTEGYKAEILNQSSNECSCGWQSKGCHLENRKKVCDCNLWYAQKDDECKPCDCGFGGTKCHFNENGEINCTCLYGFAQTSYGKCESCYCGGNAKKCEFQGYKKVCTCDYGYIETDGKCKLCDCGFNSISCRFDWSKVRRCVCEKGYVSLRRTSYDEDEVCRIYTELNGWKTATYILSFIIILIIVILFIIIWNKRPRTCGMI